MIPYVPSAIFRSDGLIGDANILIITSVGLVNTGDDGSVSSFSTDSGDPVAAYFTANELNDFVFIVFIHILDNNNDLCIFLFYLLVVVLLMIIVVMVVAMIMMCLWL